MKSLKISRIIVLALVSVCIFNSCKNNNKVKVQASVDTKASLKKVNLVAKGENSNSTKLEYILIEDDGVVVERFDSKVTDENRFNHDNKIFVPKNKVRYSYKYIDTSGKEYLFKDCDLDKDGLWDISDIDKVDKKTINSVLVTVLEGMSVFKNIPDYSQTIIKYEARKEDGAIAYKNSVTGVIENEANIWMHPIRTKNFRSLELNPFPFIKKPYSIGNKWLWKLNIGDQWGNKNWKEWKGSIENKYEYEIVDKLKLVTKLGLIECYKIKSTATSRIGKTSLMAYFSEKYGFVKLDYTNINKTKIVFEMTEFIKHDKMLDSRRF